MADQAPGSVEKKKTIVIVEDELDTADMFAEMMRLTGYQVYESHGGRTAFSLISETRPDAILLDLMMPGLSGLEVLALLRQEPRLAGIPVIIVSAKGFSADIKAGLDAGAATYLTKPVAFRDLKEAVECAIRNANRS